MEGLMVILSPLIAFAIIALFGRKIGDLASAIICTLGGALSFLFSTFISYHVISSQNPIHLKLYNFLPLQNFTLSFGLYFDTLSSITTSIVTSVATLIFVYSIGYMHDLFGQWTYKFYAYLSLFLFAMLLILLSDNLLGIFFGWEGVGLASYLLIGYFHETKKAANASLEAFTLNRVGDWLFIFGIIYCFYLFGTLDLLDIFKKVNEVDKNLLGVAALLLFGGAVGKSGQLPLHTWLPNAMAGPTPVSALLHAATMVAAGVYLVARVYPVFENAPQSLKVVALVGGVTALFAALSATVQTDIKKIIAFSTMSQLGLMYLALGVGDQVGAMFHLTTHAFFKALLFLSAGSVIHAFGHHVHDIFEVGNLRKQMPITYGMFMVGALALAGVFPLSGFWSKDRIIGSVYEASFGLGVLASVVSLLTAYYIFREAFVMFHGEERHKVEVHESEGVMVVPMVVLAVMAVGAGFFEAWYSGLFGAHKEIHIDIAVISVVVAVVGIVIAYMVYVRGVVEPHKMYESLKVVHVTLKEQFFTEKLYHNLLANGYMLYSSVLYAVFEKQFIDRVVESTYRVSSGIGDLIKSLHTGKINHYMWISYLGITIFLILLIITGG